MKFLFLSFVFYDHNVLTSTQCLCRLENHGDCAVANDECFKYQMDPRVVHHAAFFRLN